MDNMENASIRVDAATQQGSVFDVVKMVLGCDSSSANTTFRRLKEDFPELGAEGGTGCPTLSKMRINGKGQLTPRTWSRAKGTRNGNCRCGGEDRGARSSGDVWTNRKVDEEFVQEEVQPSDRVE